MRSPLRLLGRPVRRPVCRPNASQLGSLARATLLIVALGLHVALPLAAQEPTTTKGPATTQGPTRSPAEPSETRAALRRAVQFFQTKVAVEGGYVYQVTADLKLREGEGDAGQSTVWTQPPGTPAVGLALVEAYERTGEPVLLAAAQDAARCLIRGQLHSGGWQNHIDFDPELRKKQAYRIDGKPSAKARNISSFDDDQTQCVLRFLMKLDRALQFKDATLHEAIEYALAAVMRNQFPNGAWSQGFERLDPAGDYPILKANYPDTWSRQHAGSPYWFFYTLNDQAHVRVMQTMWLASQIYDRADARASALRAADFLIAAQMPEPQPAWAQQYNYQMQPVWARKFEPPAISGGESQVVIEALMDLAEATGDAKFLAPIPKALAYLRSSQLADGRLARFYELKSNQPLYFTRQYELTNDDSDVPTHYAFKVPSRVDALAKRYEQLRALDREQLLAAGKKNAERQASGAPSADSIAKIVASMNSEGAWIEPGKLRYIREQPLDRPMIHSETFIKNVDMLSRAIARSR